MPEYRELNGVVQKQCSKCKEWRRPEGFATNRKSSDFLSSHCLRCYGVKAREWQKDNPLKAREISKKAGIKRAQRTGYVNPLYLKT